MNKFLSSFAYFFYPNRCVGCYEIIKSKYYFCFSCTFNLPKLPIVYGKNNDVYSRLSSFEKIYAAYSYLLFSDKGIVKNLIHSIKYEGNIGLAEFVAKNFAKNIKNIVDADCIIPVPLHPQKRKKRGYNQSEIITRTMANVLNVESDITSLVRLKNTSTQTKKDAESRANNMKNAFKVVNRLGIENKKILLVDDVITTGATILECVKAITIFNPMKITVASIAFAY